MRGQPTTMKTRLVPQTRLGAVRYMTQPTGGDGSAQDTGAGSNPDSSAGGNTDDGDNGFDDQSKNGGNTDDGDKSGDDKTKGDDKAKDGDIESFPPEAQAMIRDLRRESGNYRSAKKAAEEASEEARTALIQDLGKALGLVDSDDGDKAPSPEDLTAQISAERDAHQATKVELAVYRTATAHSADPDALLDSRAFLAKVAKLNPSEEGFKDKVGDAIKAAVDDNPKLKLAGQAPGRSGGQVNGGGANSASEQTSEQLASRIRSRRPY